MQSGCRNDQRLCARSNSGESVVIGYRPYPETEALAGNYNLHLDSLRERLLSDQSSVYCYVIASIHNHEGVFYQTGSGPNFQGGLITLCACKHFMRTFRERNAWIGQWIASLSGLAAGNRRNVLVYLMKVGHAFDSYQSLWASSVLPKETKGMKAADRNKFGDLYRPKKPGSDPFDHGNYEPPVADHSHFINNQWHIDINYERFRRQAFLVGEPVYSFVWNRPAVAYANGRIHRGQKKMALAELLLQLEELNR